MELSLSYFADSLGVFTWKSYHLQKDDFLLLSFQLESFDVFFLPNSLPGPPRVPALGQGRAQGADPHAVQTRAVRGSAATVPGAEGAASSPRSRPQTRSRRLSPPSVRCVLGCSRAAPLTSQRKRVAFWSFLPGAFVEDAWFCQMRLRHQVGAGWAFLHPVNVCCRAGCWGCVESSRLGVRNGHWRVVSSPRSVSSLALVSGLH